MDRAIAALQAGDAVRRIPERRPGFDRRFAKGVGMACGDLVEIDVHRTLCGGALGYRIPVDRPFAEPGRFTIGGTSVLTHPALTPDGLSAEARRWGGEAVLAEAVRTALSELTFDAPAVAVTAAMSRDSVISSVRM